VLQWSVVVFLLYLATRAFFERDFFPDYEAYCPFGGIQALGSYLLNDSLACSMTTTQIAMGIMLIVGVILFSKLFCSYICPVGTISEWLGKAGDKFKLNLKISGTADRIMRSFKYLLLFVTFYFTLQSNELFCRKYDPFFAVASGFSFDVVLLYALPALAILILGSLLYRLFWCKYLCPLGAVSNIFKFTWFFALIILIYVIVLKTGFQLSYIWPLAVACAGGYILEIWGEKYNFLPVAKITRNESSCTSCQLCSKRCPQAIDVAKMSVVNSADCNLCGDCLEVCPEKETLLINRKSWLKRMPLVAVIVLFLMALVWSFFWELPTISQRWATPEEIKKASLFTKSGLSEIKCYSSSMAFAKKMKQVNGVLGVATYVTSHRVEIYYNPALLNDTIIQKEIFKPQRMTIRPVEDSVQTVKIATCMLENFFDPADFSKLFLLLREKTDALGLGSEFSCPVTVRIYLPGNSELNETKLKELLDAKSLDLVSEGSQLRIDLSFKQVGKTGFRTISVISYKQSMFDPYEDTFNWKSSYSTVKKDTLVVPAGNNETSPDSLAYFVSHISNDTGVVGFQSIMDSTATVLFKIIYIDSLTNEGNIIKSMNSDSLTINYEGGEIGKLVNRYKF